MEVEVEIIHPQGWLGYIYIYLFKLYNIYIYICKSYIYMQWLVEGMIFFTYVV